MEYRKLGRTQFKVSVIGFGTCQLRLMPEKNAIDALLKGFDLGVNIVHTAPEYGNAEDLVAKAVSRTNKKIIVASQGHDRSTNECRPVQHFASLFDATCKRFKTDRLDLFGIACIDDREAFRENVWGKNGMIEFLQQKKVQGQLGGIFCTTHGAPEYVKQLVTCGVFDAIMIAYNPLGYHLLTCNPTPGRHFECLSRNKHEIFPLCKRHEVGLMIMKPLAGGLLCESQAFPARHHLPKKRNNAIATDFLRSILLNQEVTCVMPGITSIAEAEENARSGYAPIIIRKKIKGKVANVVKEVSSTVCSRCGACEPMCSQGLPISWIFRAALINLYPSMVFESLEHMEYFRLNPKLEAMCATCPSVTCNCPNGINIPESLKEIHSRMIDLMHRKLIPAPDTKKGELLGDSFFGSRIVSLDIPDKIFQDETYLCRLYLENAGTLVWSNETWKRKACIVIWVLIEDKMIQTIELKNDIPSGVRWHVLFEFTAPKNIEQFNLRVELVGEHNELSNNKRIIVLSKKISTHIISTNDTFPNKKQIIRRVKWHCKTSLKSLFLFFKRNLNVNISSSNKYVTKIKSCIFSTKHRHPDKLTGMNKEVSSNSQIMQVHDSKLSLIDSEFLQQPYGVNWLENNLPSSLPKGELYQIYLQAENSGSRPWTANHPEGNCVDLLIYLNNSLHSTVRVPHDVAPGERVILTFPFTFPDSSDSGIWMLSFSFVEQNVAWFHHSGVKPLKVKVKAEEPERGYTAEAVTIARRSNWGFWIPSQGITRSRKGRRYPLFIKYARGCRVRDLENNEWIDYVMGGGSALLGYAHPEIRNAIIKEIDSSAVITLPHVLEIKVTQMLCDMIPCAEMALFGKHGSDVCTAAIRIARLHTGRRKVLYSGYHGWHDWYVETLEPKLKISSEPTTLFRFSLNDLSSFRNLVKEHTNEIAAVILEPAAQAGNLDGPVCDIDPVFLKEVAKICQLEKAVLVFDEIVTGFRYPKGSVQQATGVIPDLACFGKALSAGMPLSVLVGRRKIMEKSCQSAYFPTFRGEVYSLAAAHSALQMYKRIDVPKKINIFGNELKKGINNICQEEGIDGQIIGLPFRMLFKFNESNELQRVLMRTLLQQELLQRGILTYNGYMLPSIAHGENEIKQTLSAFRAALQHVREVSSEQTFARNLDIPLF